MLKLPVELYIASRYVRSNIRQSLMIAMAVGIGVSIIIFIPSVNLSFFNYFIEKTVENSAHIRLTREEDTMPRNRLALTSLFPQADTILHRDQTLTRERNIKAYRRLMDELKRRPDILEASPYISEQVIIVRGTQVRAADLKGIEPKLEKKIRNLEDEVVAGNIDTLSSNQVFLGWRLAEELGVTVGNRIQLVTSSGEKSVQKSFKVAGITNTGMWMSDYSSVLMSLQTAQSFLNLPNEATGVGIKIKNIYDAETLGKSLARTYNMKSQSWMEDSAVILDQIRMFRVIIAFISFLIVFAAASSITSVLIMVVSSKSKEIGILKAMGMAPGTLIRIFVTQAIFLSILGSLAGIVGGIGLIELYNATPFSRAETFLGIARQPVTLNAEYTGYAIFYAMLSSFLASLFPAWQAGKLDPVKAINQ